jgi:teichuronic acid biosynthesis glycosyltransferase TuaC
MSRPLRILTFSTLYPSGNRPGHGIFVEARLRELLKRGAVEAKVIAPVPWFPSTDPRWGDYARMAAVPAREVLHGIDVVHPRYPLLPKVGMSSAPLSMALGARASVRKLLDEGFDFDLIDAHYFYPDGVAAALLARWFGKPFIVTARGTDLNLIPQYTLPRKMMQWAAKRAASLIGVSQALADVLLGWGLAAQKVHVIRNGVNLDRFAPQEAGAARARLGLAPQGPMLLSVGNLVELKGHALLIEALHLLRDEWPALRLVIAGEGPERPRLQAQIERLGLAERVRLLGAVPNAALCDWYCAADLFLLPSSREGLPNALLEALACGTPVLASAVGGIPEVLADAGAAGALLPERSAAGIAAALRQWLGRERDRAAVRRVALGYSWQHSIDALTALMRATTKQVNHA